jgi:hypothetical protein
MIAITTSDEGKRLQRGKKEKKKGIELSYQRRIQIPLNLHLHQGY